MVARTSCPTTYTASLAPETVAAPTLTVESVMSSWKRYPYESVPAASVTAAISILLLVTAQLKLTMVLLALLWWFTTRMSAPTTSAPLWPKATPVLPLTVAPSTRIAAVVPLVPP